MSYIDENLTSGETVLYRTQLHWIVLLWPMLLAVLSGSGALALFVASANASGGTGAGPMPVLGMACAAVAAAAAVFGVVRRSSTEMAVTNRRVLMKTGFIKRRTVDLMIAKVESIGVNQGVMARVFGYGSVVLRGTGGTYETFDRIERPLEFRRRVQEQINPLQTQVR